MFFNLGHVMRNIVNHMHVQIVGSRVEDFRERLI